MQVHRDALWLLMAACCVPSVLIAVRLKLRRTSSPRLGAVADGILTGMGVGLGAATVLLVLSAAWVALF